jgi:hypothetical protein
MAMHASRRTTPNGVVRIDDQIGVANPIQNQHFGGVPVGWPMRDRAHCLQLIHKHGTLSLITSRL